MLARRASCDCAHRLVVDIENIDRVFFLQPVLVDAHDHVLAAVDTGLLPGRGLLDAQLGHAGFDGLGHAAGLLHLLDQLPGLVGDVLGQAFHHVGTAPGVDHLGDTGFFLDHQLGIAGNPRGKLRGQRNGFIQRVGVQGLGAAKYRRHGLDGGAHHVVVGVLLGQGPAGGLAVGAQHGTLGILRVELS